MTRNVDLSDNWSIVQYTRDSSLLTITAEHGKTGVEMVVKELPNGAELRLQIPADLPGGFDVVHTEEYEDFDRSESVADDAVDAALSELERFGAMYDTEETWLIEGAPVLH